VSRDGVRRRAALLHTMNTMEQHTAHPRHTADTRRARHGVYSSRTGAAQRIASSRRIAVPQCGAALASTRRAHRASRRDSARTSNAAPSYRMHMHTHTIGCRPYIRRPRRVRVTLVERVSAL
jgi:Tfp pilus assembly protein PilE